MSYILPPRIEPGTDLADLLQQILDYLKSITPMSSDTIHVDHTPDGCLFHLTDQQNRVDGVGLLSSVGGTAEFPDDDDEEEEDEPNDGEGGGDGI